MLQLLNNPFILNQFDDLKIEMMHQEIEGLIRFRSNGIINPCITDLMAISLTQFVINSIDKFIKGQKEHGGDIRDGNKLDKEIRDEQIDLFWYSEAKLNWPNHIR